ncbi:type II and III secretion system protein family protein [Marinobacter sediminum]|uniref:type II and III secretion system protein family protein n=1 Tax=Marinobacter sediminum TaxID=256323 RepID=UPI00202F0CCB|nr:type II and III secretion system protein family protein [Marinobacter sediminum]MCM0612002.1 type II and III secretion system protein family protein [Marinobacter sediminum]
MVINAMTNQYGKLMRSLAFLLVAVTGMAEAADRYVLEFGDRHETTELHLSIGKSQIIYSRSPLDQVVIGSPDIADIKLLSSRQVLILGMKPGHTNLVFRDKNQSLIAVMDVVVGYDLNQIKRKVWEVLPREDGIEVRGSNDSVILSGQVSSPAALKKALSVAESFVPEDKVVNMMQVAGGSQVMLEVRITEISRQSLRELGVQLDLLETNDDVFDIVTGLVPNNTPFLSGVVSGNAGGRVDSIEATLSALERHGLAKILAEPNLTALSGQEASFLAGGEVPIPVSQSGAVAGAITVDYREFGVGLKFTPTVLDNQTINVKLNAEVSSLDDAIGFQNAGFNIPGITTRRAGTTVEMGDGQSFAIAGLLQNNLNDVVNEVPGLGRIPVLGALFRSTEYQRNETELVVIVTPRLVTPREAGSLADPTQVFLPANRLDQYLMGWQQHYPSPQRNLEGSDKSVAPETNTSGGMGGSFGHQVQKGEKQ